MSNEAIQYVELKKLSLRPQVRERAADEAIAGLAASIKAAGLKYPLRVRRVGERLVVLDGERRLRAVHSLGWQHVPVIIEERELSEVDAIRLQIVVNAQRKGLTPLEFARALQELMEGAGFNVNEAAAACGFSAATVSRHLKLLEAPGEVQEKVANGELAASTAYEIAKVSDPAKQVELANAATAGALSREAVKQRANGARKRTTRASIPSVRAELGGNRSIAVQGPGLLDLATLITWLTEALDACKQALALGGDLESLSGFLRTERQRHVA